MKQIVKARIGIALIVTGWILMVAAVIAFWVFVFWALIKFINS